MEDYRYSRNRLYINDQEQEAIKNFPILLAGSGLGSVIAECALRIGFENISLVDGDNVELSNLNRQNYTANDIGKPKTEAILNRLKQINENANITCHNYFLTEKNVEDVLKGHKVAINALDFSNNMPVVFDKACQKHKIPVLHPYNFGWEALVTVVTADTEDISYLEKASKGELSEQTMADYIIGYQTFWNNRKIWLEEVVEKYELENKESPPPQLAIGSWIVAGMCTNLLFNIATERKVKVFPKFYMSELK